MLQEQLNLSGTALRDVGIKQAEDHAERVSPGWSVRAMDYLVNFLRQQGSVPFMSEYFRTWAYAHGLERAPHDRAFGGLIVRARKKKLIEFVGYEQVSNPRAHRTPAAKWKAA